MKMVTPPGGLTLDLFCGSGSVGIAAMREGFRFLGIERENTEREPFVDVARARIEHAVKGEPARPKTKESSNQTSLPWAENQ